MSPRRVLCISAGMLQPKKVDNPLARLHMYLNYGLLGLASIIQREGIDAFVVHGRFDDPQLFIRRLIERDLLTDADLVLLSLPSSFSISWAKVATASIRELMPSARIVAGGRWVIADDQTWIRSQLPAVNEFAQGLADGSIMQIVSECATTPESVIHHLPPLNYELLHDWQKFHPSIEVSRGCGMHCTFCAEAEVPLSAMKASEDVANELATYQKLVGGSMFHAYFETSIFRPSSVWIQEFSAHVAQRRLSMQWRTESRVDTLTPAMIESLAKTGLKVVDLGLESASHQQLKAMGKSRNPSVYLKRAAELLRACSSNGVWAKVNVLLYPGETSSSFRETTDWLESHRQHIKGLSVGPTILYRYGQSSRSLLAEFEKLGASAVDTESLDGRGYAQLHLSSEMPHDAAMEISFKLSKEFMTGRDYFDLKGFSYLPPDFTLEDFQRIAKEVPAEHLPFRAEQ
jgi:radical SAM superfamily enzyme YgiQ (UPF0313 family)